MKRTALVALLMVSLGSLRADEPEKKRDELPPPQKSANLPVRIIRVPVPEMPSAPYTIPAYPGFWRPDPWEHWKDYGIARTNSLIVPKVIMAPHPYYRATGQPYFYTPVMPGLYQPQP